MTVTVRLATAEEIRPLRNKVLREGRDVPLQPYDLAPTSRHVAAVTDDGTVIGCAVVFPEAYDDEPAAWRLRGMAVDQATQGQGVGKLVLDKVLEIARDGGAPLVWANGRSTAIGFYDRHGWQRVGEEFDEDVTGIPHWRITYDLRHRPGSDPTHNRGVSDG